MDDREDGERIDILLIEPNSGDARLFTEAFEDGKFANAFYTVSSGEEALDFLHQRGAHADKPRPDLVLLEPELPGTSGVEVVAELSDDPALKEIPVVALTSSDTGEAIVKSSDLDADHYIQKPVSPEDFLEFVQSVEEFWLAIVRREAADD